MPPSGSSALLVSPGRTTPPSTTTLTNPRLSHAELARRVLLIPQWLDEPVRSLVERGFARRQADVPRDRRIDLYLTEDGRALPRRAAPLIRALNQPTSSG
jgi:DNA-binding MarR family transcriptional regulator